MNEENTKIDNPKGKAKFPTTLIIIFFSILLLLGLLFPSSIDKSTARLILCRNNLKILGITLKYYADENSDSYPPPGKWCDLVSPYYGNEYKKISYCPAIKDNKFYYAMNPNCEPNSPPDTVLLFETQESSWNLSGGPELLSTENHKEKSCNVLFNDGHVETIRSEEIPNLKWE